MRADLGFFDENVARAVLANGADFAIVTTRTAAAWRPGREIPEVSRQKAEEMEAEEMEAEVAACDSRPAGWPEGTRRVVRRVPVCSDEPSGDRRARPSRTIDPNQLALSEGGEIGVARASSFFLANID